MDPLSDVLALLKPQSYRTAGVSAGGDWSIRFENCAGMIKCYAVTNGACWLQVDDVDDKVRLGVTPYNGQDSTVRGTDREHWRRMACPN